MVEFNKYRGPILTIVIIIVVLMVMIAIGFTIGILSEDPDGLERAVSDIKGEEWLEGLSSPWQPILGGIENDYIAGIIGILLSVVLMIAVFTLLLLYAKKRKQ